MASARDGSDCNVLVAYLPSYGNELTLLKLLAHTELHARLSHAVMIMDDVITEHRVHSSVDAMLHNSGSPYPTANASHADSGCRRSGSRNIFKRLPSDPNPSRQGVGSTFFKYHNAHSDARSRTS